MPAWPHRVPVPICSNLRTLGIRWINSCEIGDVYSYEIAALPWCEYGETNVDNLRYYTNGTKADNTRL